MPGRHNKKQNPSNTSRNQGSSTTGGQTPGQNKGGMTTPGAQHRGATPTQGGLGQKGGSSTQGNLGSNQQQGGMQGPRGNFENRTKEELYAQAKKEGIEGRSHVTKEELIRALRH